MRRRMQIWHHIVVFSGSKWERVDRYLFAVWLAWQDSSRDWGSRRRKGVERRGCS